MATRRYSVSPGQGELASVVETVGAATNSTPIEVTIDMANTVTTGSTTRPVTKDEILAGLEAIKNYILSHNWPAA